MKRYLILLSAVLLLASPTPARAQEYTAAPVEISKEKVRLDGKIYYSHVVQEKQTLYSICKAYGVTLEDVFRSNPSLNLEKEGLKKDQIILIPIPEEEKAPEQSNTKVKRKLKVDDPEAEAAAKKAAQEKAARAAEERRRRRKSGLRVPPRRKQRPRNGPQPLHRLLKSGPRRPLRRRRPRLLRRKKPLRRKRPHRQQPIRVRC